MIASAVEYVLTADDAGEYRSILVCCSESISVARLSLVVLCVTDE